VDFQSSGRVKFPNRIIRIIKFVAACVYLLMISLPIVFFLQPVQNISSGAQCTANPGQCAFRAEMRITKLSRQKMGQQIFSASPFR